jgi:hypothetical protein
VFSFLDKSSCPREFRSLTATEAAIKFSADKSAVSAVQKKGGDVGCAATLVTTDAVCSLALLSNPSLVAANAALLTSVARGGTLQAFPSRGAARITMALSRATDPVACPFPEAFLALPTDDASDLTLHLVPLLKEMLTDPTSHRELYEPEDALYSSTLEAISKDLIKIERYPQFDLAVVDIDSRVGKISKPALMSEITFPGVAAGSGDAPGDVAASDPIETKNIPGRVLIHHPPQVSFEYTPLSTLRLLAHADTAPRQHELRPLVDKLNTYERSAQNNKESTFWTMGKDKKGFECESSGLAWSLVKERVSSR